METAPESKLPEGNPGGNGPAPNGSNAPDGGNRPPTWPAKPAVVRDADREKVARRFFGLLLARAPGHCLEVRCFKAWHERDGSVVRARNGRGTVAGWFTAPAEFARVVYLLDSVSAYCSCQPLP